MKKKLITPAVAAIVSASAALLSCSAVLAGGPQEMVIMAPSPFDGFYLGGSGSFHLTGFDIDGDLNFVNTVGIPFTFPLASQSGGDSSTDAYGGIRGGFGRVFMRRWYAGVEGFADFGTATGSISNTALPSAPLGTTANLTNKGQVGTDWGVAARLGVLLSPTTLAYAKLGAEWADVKAQISDSESLFGFSFGPFFASSNSSNQSGFLWGFGLEQFVWRDVVSVFAEYTYVSLGSTSTTGAFNFLPNFVPDTTAFIGPQATNKVSANISSFAGGLNFHFGQRWL